MSSIKRKLENSPGYFKKHAESTVELPPTPRKAKAVPVPMQKMLFKDLISAKYFDKDLGNDSLKDEKLEMLNKSVECSPINSSPLKKAEITDDYHNIGLGLGIL